MSLDSNTEAMQEILELANTLPDADSDSTKAIVDVVALPTENIDDNVFYRVPTGRFINTANPAYDPNYPCYFVEGLPETGIPVVDSEWTLNVYYNMTDEILYGYVDDVVADMFETTVGWQPFDVLAPIIGLPWGGIVTEIPSSGEMLAFLLLNSRLVSYENEKWIEHRDSVGWKGTGECAEIFNAPYNIASGDYSHAEGISTTASWIAAHAEGVRATASGFASHAEGGYTTASGENSHAEGDGTIAARYAQHVQGVANIEDTEDKYLHIVGNGYYGYETNDYVRSNAHTLDWNGLGWFAGGLKVGGTGQDDENAVNVLTMADMERIISSVISALPVYNGEVEAV